MKKNRKRKKKSRKSLDGDDDKWNRHDYVRIQNETNGVNCLNAVRSVDWINNYFISSAFYRVKPNFLARVLRVLSVHNPDGFFFFFVATHGQNEPREFNNTEHESYSITVDRVIILLVRIRTVR